MSVNLHGDFSTDLIGHWVNGKPFQGQIAQKGVVWNPASGEVQAHVAMAGRADVMQAIRVAEAAFPTWSRMPPPKRAGIFFRFRELLEDATNELAAVISRENGKTIADAKGEVVRGIEIVDFACGIPHLLKGDYTEQVGAGIDSWSVRQPLGVVACITPFNFPVMVPLWMVPMAIACGNTVILKPSERVPSAALRLAELFKQAGLPDGVFNVVNGDKAAVDVLLQAPAIQAISFVGSTTVAQDVYAEGARHGKRVQAFGGAKNHMVVLPDADLDRTVDALIGAGYGSAGERCMAISVAVVVSDEVGDALIARLTPRIRALKVGPGNDPEAEFGPLVTSEHLERVKSYLNMGVSEGAELVVDGRGLRLQGYEGGFFIGGGRFAKVQPGMRIYGEEIFGPVLSIVRVPDFEQALHLVNDHEYGNGTAIFTRDGDAAREFTSRVKIGMVGVNVPIPVPAAYHSFGGWKRSSFGDHNMYGPEAVRFFTRLKTITSRWPAGIRAGAEFVMPSLK